MFKYIRSNTSIMGVWGCVCVNSDDFYVMAFSVCAVLGGFWGEPWKDGIL